MRVLITGANGYLGQKLIKRLGNLGGEPVKIVAVVRSEAAATALKAGNVTSAVHVVDYRNTQALANAAAGCDTVVHLVGIIKESRHNSFNMAHEQTCEALIGALIKAQGTANATTVKRILHIGIIGADPGSANACFKSRAAAEHILLSGPIPATVIRVPMMLGKDAAASRVLAEKCRAACCLTFRASSLEQPIDSDDVIEAILAALSSGSPLEFAPGILELAGPESLSRSALIRRASRCLAYRAGRPASRSPVVISLPIGLGYFLASVLEFVSSRPPVTRAMLGVLDHDDRVDIQNACELLGLKLTPLDETLDKVLQE